MTTHYGNSEVAAVLHEYGLNISRSDNDTISIGQGRIYASDERTIIEVGVAGLTALASDMGESEPDNGIMYPWLGINAGGTTVAWLDTDPDTPTLTPGGVGAKRYIGPGIVNISSNIRTMKSFRSGRSVTYIYQGLQSWIGTGSCGTSLVEVSYAALVPSRAKCMTIWVDYAIGTTAFHTNCLYNDAGSTLVSFVKTQGSSFGRNNPQHLVPLRTGGSLWRQASYNDDLYVSIVDWMELI